MVGWTPPSCVLFLVVNMSEFYKSKLVNDFHSMKGKQRSPSSNAYASLCIKRTFIMGLNWGQVQAAKVSWRGEFGECSLWSGQGSAGCGNQPILCHQRVRLLFRREGTHIWSSVLTLLHMIENVLFPGKFYVAETKANCLMWVLPTPLRVVILNSFNLMDQIGVPSDPQQWRRWFAA